MRFEKKTPHIIFPRPKTAYREIFILVKISQSKNRIGARFYDPELGVWMTPDPLNEFSNPYSCVGGNVTNLKDPNGVESDKNCDMPDTDQLTEGYTCVNTVYGSFYQKNNDSWKSKYSLVSPNSGMDYLWYESLITQKIDKISACLEISSLSSESCMYKVEDYFEWGQKYYNSFREFLSISHYRPFEHQHTGSFSTPSYSRGGSSWTPSPSSATTGGGDVGGVLATPQEIVAQTQNAYNTPGDVTFDPNYSDARGVTSGENITVGPEAFVDPKTGKYDATSIIQVLDHEGFHVGQKINPVFSGPDNPDNIERSHISAVAEMPAYRYNVQMAGQHGYSPLHSVP